MTAHPALNCRVSLAVSAWLVLTLSACGGGGGGSTPGPTGATGVNGSSGQIALIKVSAEAASANCANTGSRIDAGLDKNNNGSLEAAEVSTTQYVCKGVNGNNALNTLISMVNEAASSNCATGGKKINLGADTNRNGVLDASEITTSSYVCNGANGSTGATGATGTAGSNGKNTLFKIADEAAGSNCAYGGSYVQSGLDADTSGTLDAAEVTSSVYVCNGSSGGLSWVTVNGTSVQTSSNTGYIITNDASTVDITLPANPTFGDVIRINGAGAGGWRILQNAGQSIYIKNLPGEEIGMLPKMSPPNGNAWQRVGISANGQVMVVQPGYGQMYRSNDGGQTWSAVSGSFAWSDLAYSSDGTQWLAAPINEPLKYSGDSGATWSDRSIQKYWRSVAVSSDGSRMTASADGGYFCFWDSDGNSPCFTHSNIKTWYRMRLSQNGQKLLASAGTSQIYNMGDRPYNTPNSVGANVYWTAFACDDRCERFHATSVEYGTGLYYTDDNGSTWKTRLSGLDVWYDTRAYNDGVVVTVAGQAGLYLSQDRGLTWTAVNKTRNWQQFAVASDTQKWIAAGPANMPFYVSSDWTTPGTAGSLNAGAMHSVELQYVGNGKFTALSGKGNFSAR